MAATQTCVFGRVVARFVPTRVPRNHNHGGEVGIASHRDGSPTVAPHLEYVWSQRGEKSHLVENEPADSVRYRVRGLVEEAARRLDVRVDGPGKLEHSDPPLPAALDEFLAGSGQPAVTSAAHGFRARGSAAKSFPKVAITRCGRWR